MTSMDMYLPVEERKQTIFVEEESLRRETFETVTGSCKALERKNKILCLKWTISKVTQLFSQDIFWGSRLLQASLKFFFDVMTAKILSLLSLDFHSWLI